MLYQRHQIPVQIHQIVAVVALLQQQLQQPA